MGSKTKKIQVLGDKAVKVLQRQVAGSKKQAALPSHSRKHLVKPEFGELIRLTNLVPDGIKSIDYLRNDAGKDLQSLDALIFAEVRKLPSSLKEWLPPLPDLEDDASRARWNSGGSYEFYKKYEILTLGKYMLSMMADSEIPPYPFGPFSFVSSWVVRNKKGMLKPVLHPLLKIIRGVELTRIGRCPICNKIYWAERIDQPTCSKPHNNVRRSWILRGKYEETRPRCLKKKAATEKGK